MGKTMLNLFFSVGPTSPEEILHRIPGSIQHVLGSEALLVNHARLYSVEELILERVVLS
jgi:hypothetical protein